MTFETSLKEAIEIEWTDQLVDAICEKAIELMEAEKLDLTWTLERLREYVPQFPKGRSYEFYRGYNAGLEDAKVYLRMIMERQDLTKNS